jgi:hypothetical protein
LVTILLVTVVGPVGADRLFFLNFFPRTRNKIARIIAMIHSAIKITYNAFLEVHEPKS